MSDRPTRRFVSRGGEKLAAAIDAFGLRVDGRVCADLGSHIGGFVDCLLQRGAERVYSVDTGWGQLDWGLRNDERVVVMERTNALHVELPEPVGFVSVDVGWTKQRLILPKAISLAGAGGEVVSLLKPQYEADRGERRRGVVKPEALDGVVARVLAQVADMGADVVACVPSPVRGGGGNTEFLLHVPVG